MYDACPTNYKEGIWWQTEAFGQMARHPCPMGSVGMATRHCDEKDMWAAPDMSACTSMDFVGLTKQVSTAGYYVVTISDLLFSDIILH